jgi:hypothetical protein
MYHCSCAFHLPTIDKIHDIYLLTGVWTPLFMSVQLIIEVCDSINEVLAEKLLLGVDVSRVSFGKYLLRCSKLARHITYFTFYLISVLVSSVKTPIYHQIWESR